MSSSGPATIPCPNCGAEPRGRYCPECGQDNQRPRLEAAPMFLDAAQNLLGWESAGMRTLRGLVLDPGGLVREYVAGKRRRYVPPARLCLLALAAWLLIARGVNTDPLKMSGFELSGTASERIERVRGFILQYLEPLLYLSLPLKALLLQLLFRRSGRNLAESLVLVLYVASFSYLLGVVATPLYSLGISATGPLRMGVALLWTIRAAHAFYGVSWVGSTWRALLAGILHTVVTAVFFAAIVLVYLALSGPG